MDVLAAGVKETLPLAVRTDSLSVVVLADLTLVVRVQMRLVPKLRQSMSVTTFVSKAATSLEGKILTKFGFELDFVSCFVGIVVLWLSFELMVLVGVCF